MSTPSFPSDALSRGAISERLSPFLPWTDAERQPLPASVLGAEVESSVFVELLRDPDAIVERIGDATRRPELVLAALASIAGGSVFLSVVTGLAMGMPNLPLASGLATADVLLALAAALGPIYGTSILLSARIPIARLVAILLCASAAAMMLLAGLAPIIHVLWKLDPLWLGPSSLLVAFAASALLGGARVHGLMMLCAAHSAGVLTPDDAARVSAVARIAMLLTAFTSALAFWGFDAFFQW